MAGAASRRAMAPLVAASLTRFRLMLRISISIDCPKPAIDKIRLKRAAQAILRDAGIRHAVLSIAIVDDATIHQLNRSYLRHDYPTDVLSFLLEREEDCLEGEVVVSVDTAARSAVEYGWSTDDELLLYVIHGTLHLVGHDDVTSRKRSAMREAERRYLELFDLVPARDQRKRAALKPRK
jgi:probable rRNA maturation factor